jgi:hypothetical protein
MNILATKMGALNIGPKHKIAIFSKNNSYDFGVHLPK